MKNTQDPYLARQLSVFSPRGAHQRVNLCVCSLSQMVMQEDTKIYPGSGKRTPYVQWGREVCIILHLSAYTGVNTSLDRIECGVSTTCGCSVAWSGDVRVHSRVSTFIVPRGGLGYMCRC